MKKSLCLLVVVGVLVGARLGSFAGEETAPERSAEPPPEERVSEKGNIRWQSRIGDRRLRHGSSISDIAVSKDGRWLASSGDESVKIWDPQTGRELRSLSGHDSVGIGGRISFARDGSWIVTGADELAIWSLPEGRRLRSLRDADRWGQTNDVAVSPSGKRIATGASSETLRIWDAATGRLLRKFATGTLNQLAWSPDGKRIVTASGPVLKVWNPRTGKLVQTLKHGQVIEAVAVSPDSAIYVTGADDTVLWDAASGRRIRTIRPPKTRNPMGVVRLFGPHGLGPSALAFSPDGSWFVSGHQDGSLRTWHTRTGALRFLMTGNQGTVWSVCVTPDGKRIFSGSGDGELRSWDATTGKQHDVSAGTTSQATAAVASSDGHVVALARNQTVELRDPQSGRLLRRLEHGEPIAALAMDAKATRIASGGTFVKLWDANNGKLIRRFTHPRGKVRRDEDIPVAFLRVAPDGSSIGAGYFDGTYAVFDAAKGSVLGRVREPGAFLGRFGGSSPDGRWFVLSEEWSPELQIREAGTGQLQRRLKTRGNVSAALVMPDGKRVVSASENKKLQIWDVETGVASVTVDLTGGAVTHLVGSADSRWIYGLSKDGTLGVWDAGSGTHMDRIRLEGAGTCLVAQGTRLWVGLENATLSVYEHRPAASKTRKMK